MTNKYYAITDATAEGEADIYIFGDIVTPDWQGCYEMWGDTSTTSGLSLVNDIRGLGVGTINVHINSYGGDVSEGLAIYNALKNHAAKIRTYCDGFACSSASVIFMAGDERIMNDASILMIHNAWVSATGDANQLRKEAETLEKLMTALCAAYKTGVTVDDEQLKAMLDAETWILPEDAVTMGFATATETKPASSKAAAAAKKSVYARMTSKDGVSILHVALPEAKQPEPKPENRLKNFIESL
ncbi:MAG: Clp protease ClpP [Oscillospiraceae bacterium]